MKQPSATWPRPPEKPRTKDKRNQGVVDYLAWGEVKEKETAARGGRRTSSFSSSSSSTALRAGERHETGTLERELHDTVLQDLLCVSLGLGSLEKFQMEEAARQEIEHLQLIAAQSYERLRELASGRKHPEALPPRSMGDVLAECVRSFNLKSGAEVHLQLNDEESSPTVSGEAARQAGLIVHEALCNAWRHAEASAIKVVLSETADIVWVKVIDDGKGFDPSVRRPGHYGLGHMRGRADAIGARLGISSAPSQGTCVNLYLPGHHAAPTTLPTNLQEVFHGNSLAGRR